MLTSRTPWVTKLKPEQEPLVVDDPKSGGRMLIPTPLLVAEEVRKTRKGRLVTPVEIRERLAARFKADVTCPLTTGIFLGIVAGAAEEQLRQGKRPVAPYWRVVQPDRKLNPKFPPGPAVQAEHLRGEGWKIERTGRTGALCVGGRTGGKR